MTELIHEQYYFIAMQTKAAILSIHKVILSLQLKYRRAYI